MSYRRRRKKSQPRKSRRKKHGVTFTDDQKLQLLARGDLDDDLKKKILRS